MDEKGLSKIDSKPIRISPRLDIKGPTVVKGIHMEGLRVVGEPAALAKKYYEEGADELIFLDIVASLYQRNFDFDLLKSATKDIFIPVTVGGGLRSVDDIRKALSSGADKVAINTAAIKNPSLLKEAVEVFGGQCIVLYVEAKRQDEDTWEAYIDGGRERTDINVVDWIKEGVDMGVGEVLLSSIDADGTKLGYDIDLVKRVTPGLPVPIIVHGGCWSSDTAMNLLESAEVDMIAAASMFHYDHLSIDDFKKKLAHNGVKVRLP